MENVKKESPVKNFFAKMLRRRKYKKKEKFTPVMWVLLIILLLYSAAFILLLLWALGTSLKVNQKVFDLDPFHIFPNYNWYKGLADTAKKGSKAWLAGKSVLKAEEEGSLMFYTYRNMIQLFSLRTPNPAGEIRTVYMGEMYLYSLLYALGCALTNTIVPCVVAYCCARFKYKFSKIVHTVVIVTMIIPIVGSLPSEIRLTRALGIYNTIWGLWIMKANFLGLYFLVFYDIFKALPDSIIEAAKIDGANNFQIFFRIAMPLIKNTFFTVLLIKFITFWNDYQTPSVFMGSYPTISYVLNLLMNRSMNIPGSTFVPTDLPARMATVVLSAAPVLVLYIVFQKRLLGNLTMGGVKG